MVRELDALNNEYGEKVLRVKIGIHAGAAIAVTVNDHLDYFGETVNVASRVQSLASDSEVCLTRDMFERSGYPMLSPRFRCRSPRPACGASIRKSPTTACPRGQVGVDLNVRTDLPTIAKSSPRSSIGPCQRIPLWSA